MKLTILFVSAAVISYTLFASNPKKNEVKVNPPKVNSSKIYLETPKCPSDAVLNNYVAVSDEIPPYKHCSSCSMGAFLGDEGNIKCTYCGIKGD